VDRGDVDDGAHPGTEHQWQRVLATKPCALEIDGKDRIPFRLGHPRRVEIGVHTGVVDQNVHASELLGGSCDRLLHVGFRGDVRAIEENLAPPFKCIHRRPPSRLVAIQQRHAGALCDEFLDGGTTDTASAARHQSGLALEAHPILRDQHAISLQRQGWGRPAPNPDERSHAR